MMSATKQWSYFALAEGAGQASSDTASAQNDLECMQWIPNAAGTAVDGRADFVSLDATGFTIDWIAGLGTRRWHWLAIKGGSWDVGSLTLSTVQDATVDGVVGFEPAGAFLIRHGGETAAGASVGTIQTAMGAFSSLTNRGAQGLFDQDNVATMNSAAGVEHDAVLVAPNSAGAITLLIDVSAIGADRFTLINTDPSPATSIGCWVAVGPPEPPQLRPAVILQAVKRAAYF